MSAPVLEDDLAAALAALAAAPAVVVASDFDGVLAPIVPVPADATPLPETVTALRRLAAAPGVLVGLVSGRSAADGALARAAVPGAAVVGSHGAERGLVDDDGALQLQPSPLDDDQRALLERLATAAAELTDAVDGAWLETKPTAVVVHTRPVADGDAAAVLERTALDRLGSLPGVRAIAGKRVVELSVASATKGDAVELLRTGLPGRELPGGAHVLYLGDDVTDEDAFRALGAGDVGIKVGDGDTVAAFRVPDPEAVAALLTLLADHAEQRTA